MSRHPIPSDLLLTISLLLLSILPCPLRTAQTQACPLSRHAQIASAGSEAARHEQDVWLLKPNKPIEKELAGGQAHFYRIALPSGQYARIVVDQRGIDVMVSLFGPDQKRIMEVDSPNGEQGMEEFYMVVEAPDGYRIEVRSPQQNAAAGRYEINLADVRAATATDRDRYAAEQLYHEGEALTREGSLESRRVADAKYKQALLVWRRCHDRKAEADTLMSLGMNDNGLRKSHDALIHFEQSVPLFQAMADRPNQVLALNRIALIYDLFGDHEKALQANRQVLTLTRQLNDQTGEARSLSNMAKNYFNLGEAQIALHLFKEALSLQQAAGDHSGEPNTLNNIAKSYDELGDKQNALAYLEKALKLYQETKSKLGEAIVYTNIANIHYDLRNPQKALDYFNRALPIWQESNSLLGEARARSGIGRVYAALGNVERALDFYQQALKIRRDLGDKGGEVVTTYYLARLERDRGDLTQAISLSESVLALVESLRSKVSSQDLRASFLGTKQGYYEFYIDLLMRQHHLHPSAGYDLRALAASERARARSLVEMLTEAKAGIRRGLDPQLLEAERQLQQRINAKATEQVTLLNTKHTRPQAEAVAQQLSALRSEYLQLEAEMRTRSPRYAVLMQPQPLTLAEIQQQVLDPDTLMLEYALGEERSYLWAVRQSSIVSFELPKRAEVEAEARRVYDLLTARNRRSAGETLQQRQARLTQAEAQYQEAAAALSQMVLSPAASMLKTKRLLIVCDGALQYIPFAALPMPAGGRRPVAGSEPTSDDAENRRSSLSYSPLIAEHEIVSLPSASVLAVLRREMAGRKPAARAVAVLADPVFDKADKRPTRAVVPASRRQRSAAVAGASRQASNVERVPGDVGLTAGARPITRLPFSRREAEAIIAVIPRGDVMKALDFKASRATATSAELAQYRIIHFATHGLLDSEHPELSGIVLSLVDEHGRPQDGFLRLHDIYNLNLPAEMVVLSACQTALGKDIRGEGLVGLTRGFMYAGAARVVASLWQVDDVATAELMRRFYRAMMRDGLRPLAALQAAQVEMWKQRRWQSPYYWAAFVLQGDWQ